MVSDLSKFGGGASTTKYKVITDHYKLPRMVLPPRSGTRKSNTPTKVCLNGLV